LNTPRIGKRDGIIKTIRERLLGTVLLFLNALFSKSDFYPPDDLIFCEVSVGSKWSFWV
jgi:hypothetical protein